MKDSRTLRLSVAVEGQPLRFIQVHLLPDDDDLFGSYFREYEALINSKPMQDDIPCGLNFSAGVDKPPTFKASIPSKDDIAILLYRLRPIILEKERTYFHRVAKRMRRRLQDPAIHESLDFLKTQWSGQYAQSQVPITLNQEEFANENLLLTWLYAYEYHRDPKLQAEMSKLRRSVPEPMLDFAIWNLACDKIRAACNLAAFVALLNGKLKELGYGNITIKRVEDDATAGALGC